MKVLIIDDGRGFPPDLEPPDGGAEAWEPTFAPTTTAALARLAGDAYDAVVVDPSVIGEETPAFLGRLGADHPAVMRIVLTGPGSCSPTGDALSVELADEAVPRPSSADELRRVVGQAVRVSASGDPDALRAIVGRLGTLPARPGLYAQLRVLIDRQASAREIGDLIQGDVAVTAQLLRTANSALYSPGRPAVSAADVVARLGVETVSAVVLQADGIRALGIRTRSVLERMNDHSLELARLVRRLAGNHEQLVLAAMLHDIGRMVLLARFPEEATRFEAEFGEDEFDRVRVEREVIGADHALIGAYLLRLWQIPEPVVRIVEFHHEPWRLTADTDAQGRGLAGMLAAAHLVDRPYLLPEGADEGFADLVRRLAVAAGTMPAHTPDGLAGARSAQ
jgi:putative nucleotidyltransferase with HDIG domain